MAYRTVPPVRADLSEYRLTVQRMAELQRLLTEETGLLIATWQR